MCMIWKVLRRTDINVFICGPGYSATSVYFWIRHSWNVLKHAMPCVSVDFDQKVLGSGVLMWSFFTLFQCSNTGVGIRTLRHATDVAEDWESAPYWAKRKYYSTGKHLVERKHGNCLNEFILTRLLDPIVFHKQRNIDITFGNILLWPNRGKSVCTQLKAGSKFHVKESRYLFSFTEKKFDLQSPKCEHTWLHYEGEKKFEFCALLEFDETCNGNFLPTFRDKLLGPCWWDRELVTKRRYGKYPPHPHPQKAQILFASRLKRQIT